MNLLLLIFPQMVLFGISLWLTLLWRYPSGLSGDQLQTHIALFSVIGLVWLALFYGFGLLDLREHKHSNQLITAILSANGLGLIAAIIFFYFQPNLIITPRRFLLVDILCVLVLSTIWQFLIRSITKRITAQAIYFINLENEFRTCRTELDELTDLFTTHSLSVSDLPALKVKTAHTHQSLLFVVPTNASFSEETLSIFGHLHAEGASFVQFNDFYEDLFRRVPTTNLNDWWMLEHIHRDRMGFYPLIKRFIDIVFSLFIAVVFLITLPFVALLIKLADRGKIFFTQTRLTVNGAPFTIYKYRTMRAGTPNNTWTADHDPRVTAVGRFLRKTRLDELPQWINILRGDMSLIGPRPEQAGIVEKLREEVPYFESRHTIRPGLIGWAQLHVYAGTAEESQRKLQYDLYYLKHRSFLFDIEILLKTVAHVFFLQGK